MPQGDRKDDDDDDDDEDMVMMMMMLVTCGILSNQAPLVKSTLNDSRYSSA